MNDDAKSLVLARRARFVAAAAVAGISLSCGKEETPRPCLSIAIVDAAQPCFSVVAVDASVPPIPTAASEDAGVDASAHAASDAGSPKPDAGRPKPRAAATASASPPLVPSATARRHPQICLGYSIDDEQTGFR